MVLLKGPWLLFCEFGWFFFPLWTSKKTWDSLHGMGETKVWPVFTVPSRNEFRQLWDILGNHFPQQSFFQR